MKSQQEVRAIVDALKELYPDGICSLDYEKDYELLFSVRLAAQCTDERVNKVTPALFARFPTLEALANADISEVEQYIHSTGFFRAKARDIVLASQMILAEYGGKVPGTMEDLLKLPGVGRKTANLMLGDVFHVPASPVCWALLTAPRTLPRWRCSFGRCCPLRSPTTSATVWCSTAGRCVLPVGPSAGSVCSGPGATTLPKTWQSLPKTENSILKKVCYIETQDK